MAFIDPDEVQPQSFVDPDTVKFVDPDENPLGGTNDFGTFMKGSVLGNIPLGIAKGGDLALRGLDQAASYAAGLFGQGEEQDRILRESDARARSIQQFTEEHGGQGKAAELGQGLGSLPAMVNPATGIPAAIGGVTDLQRTLGEQGVDPQTATDVATRQAMANAVLAGTPFGQATKLGAAGMNVLAGGVADYLSQRKLEEAGYKDIAEKQFDPLDPVQRAIDVAGGFAGAAPKTSKPTTAKDSIGAKLDVLDQAKKAAEQQQTEHAASLEGWKQQEMFTPEGQVPERQMDLPFGEAAPVETTAPANASKELTSDTGQVFHPDESGLVNRLADVQNLPSYNKATGEFSPVEYLTAMRDTHVHGKNRAYRAIYDFILGAIAKMPEGRMPRIALDIDLETGKPKALTEDRRPPELLSPGEKPMDPAAGQYDPNTDTIFIGRRGENEGTIIHEVMHGLTSRLLHIYKPTDVRVRGLYKIFDSVKNDPAFSQEYGITNIDEFISETFSSPRFQAKLAQHVLKEGIVAKAGNTLKTIANEIVKALGYKTTDPEARIFTNALEEVIFHTENIVNLYAENKKFFDEAWEGKYPGSRSVPGIGSPAGKAVEVATQGGVSAAKAAQSPPKLADEHTAKQEVISKVAGMDYIPADPKVTPELINEIVGDPDSNPSIKLPFGKKIGTGNFIPGAAAFAQLHKSKLALVVYRFANNAVKRAELFGREVVQPVEKTISKLLKNDKDAALLKDLMMRELARKEDYTPDELRSAGVPDKIIMAQAEFRAMMQQALEKQNAVLRAKGLPEIKGIDAYYSARWSGPWRANVRDADGKIVWQVAEKSKSLADNAVKYLQARQPGLTYEPVTYKKGRERGDTIEAGYLDMLNLLDKDDPRIQTLKGIYEEYLEGKTDNISNQEKHQLRKTGVRGFAGDRPWSKTDVKDFFVQQFEYAKNASRWAEFQQATEGVGKLLNNPDIKQSQPNTVKWSQDYMKNQLGFGTSELFAQLDNSLAKALGTSPQKMQEYMGASKTFFYLKVLGLNIPFTISQFLQPAISTPAQHALLNSQGFKHNPIMSLIGGMQGGSAAAAWHYANGFNNKMGAAAAEKLMSPLQLEAAKYMEANQVVDINPMSDIKRNLRPTAVKMIAAPFEFTIRHSEVIARSWAFQSFVAHLEQSGVYDTKTKAGRLELFQKAEEMTQLSMTDYRASERAQIFEKGGLTGDAASTLHSFQINYLMQLSTYTKEASKGNVLPLFYFMAIQAAAGGMLGMWFIEDLDDLLDNIKKFMPHDQYMRVKNFNLKNWILDNLGETASFGLASKVSGTNIHTRMNASDQIPIWPFESGAPLDQAMGLVPFSKEIWESGKAGVTLLNFGSTPQEQAQAWYQLTPSGFKGALENQPPFTQNGISASPRDLSMGQYRRTPEESNLRTLGLRSPEEAKFMEKKYSLSKVERELMDRVQTSSKKATQFFTSGKAEDGVKELIKYTELGGDPMTVINGIPQAQINRVTTEVGRRALSAASGSRPAVLKLQRALQFYNNK